MRISIYQRIFSISDKFDIYINEKNKYLAKRTFFSFKIEIKDNNHSTQTIIRRKDFNGVKSNYEVKCSDESKYLFKTISFRKGIWELSNEENTYTIYEHEGYNYSLFRNEHQIGSCKKNEVVIFGKDKFEIEVDYDVDVEKVVAIFLILDNALFVDRGIRIKFRNKMFDDGIHRNWQWKSKTDKG